jgi:hypothetical protein
MISRHVEQCGEHDVTQVEQDLDVSTALEHTSGGTFLIPFSSTMRLDPTYPAIASSIIQDLALCL